MLRCCWASCVDAECDLSLRYLPDASGKNLCGPGIVLDRHWGGHGPCLQGKEMADFSSFLQETGFCVIRLKLGTPSW